VSRKEGLRRSNAEKKIHNYDCSFSCCWYVGYENKTSQRVVSYHSYSPIDMLAASSVQFRLVLIPLVSPTEVLGRSSVKKKMEGEIEQDEIDCHCMHILYPVDILDVTA